MTTANKSAAACDDHWPDEVSDSSIKLQQENLPSQVQQTADRLWAAGISQTVDLVLDLQQLCSCTAPIDKGKGITVVYTATSTVSWPTDKKVSETELSILLISYMHERFLLTSNNFFFKFISFKFDLIFLISCTRILYSQPVPSLGWGYLSPMCKIFQLNSVELQL